MPEEREVATLAPFWILPLAAESRPWLPLPLPGPDLPLSSGLVLFPIIGEAENPAFPPRIGEAGNLALNQESPKADTCLCGNPYSLGRALFHCVSKCPSRSPGWASPPAGPPLKRERHLPFLKGLGEKTG